MGKKTSIILVIIVSLLLASCTVDDENHGDVGKKDRAPDTLIQVSDGIDEIFTSVDSIAETMGLSESEYQAQQSEEEESQEDSQSEEESGENGEDSNQEPGQEQKGESGDSQNEEEQPTDTKTKDEEAFLKWKKIDEKLEETHKGWNNYEVESLEKGSNAEKGNEFKKNLNNLTVSVKNRDMKNILDSGSKAINSLAVFLDLYKDEIRGDLSRIKYSAYQGFLQAQNGNNDAANNSLDETKEIISRIRQRLEEDKVQDLEKLSLSISDMQLALQDDNIELLKIKRDIVVENIKTLQE